MEPRNYPAGLLPIAEVCPGVLDLAERAGPPTIEHLWRKAFELGSVPPSTHTLDAFRVTRELLPDLFAVDVAGAIEDYQADINIGAIPSIHRFAFEVTGDLEGRVPAQGRDRLHFKIDCAWHVTVREGAGRSVVLQHELVRLGERPVLDLDLVFAGIAMAAVHGSELAQVGRCFHAPGKAPVYKWSRTLNQDDMESYWSRIAAVFRRRRELVPSELCERCPMRRRCPEWMVPASYGSAVATVYKQLSGQDPLAANDVAAVRRYVKALREAADVGEAQLRALKREGAT